MTLKRNARNVVKKVETKLFILFIILNVFFSEEYSFVYIFNIKVKFFLYSFLTLIASRSKSSKTAGSS